MRPRTVLAAALLIVAGRALLPGSAAPSARRLVRSWQARVAVRGGSMAPPIEDGDWLLVDPDAWAGGAPGPGDLVVLDDPRGTGLILVKRVLLVEPDGRIDVRGDAAGASTDSRTFGPVDPVLVLGRPWLRVRPLRRAGRVR